MTRVGFNKFSVLCFFQYSNSCYDW